MRKTSTSPVTGTSRSGGVRPSRDARRGRSALRCLSIGAAVLASTVTMGLLTATSASAALPKCDVRYLDHWNDSAGAFFETYQPRQLNGGEYNPCAMGTGTRDGSVSGAYSHTPVRTLQTALNKCNGASLTVDGSYGSKTKAAVVAVQKAHRLTQDGVYGPRTALAMRWWVYETTRSGAKLQFCGYDPNE